MSPSQKEGRERSVYEKIYMCDTYLIFAIALERALESGDDTSNSGKTKSKSDLDDETTPESDEATTPCINSQFPQHRRETADGG